MTARGHSLSQPQQRIDISLAPKWDEKNSERRGYSLASPGLSERQPPSSTISSGVRIRSACGKTSLDLAGISRANDGASDAGITQASTLLPIAPGETPRRSASSRTRWASSRFCESLGS